MWICFEKSSEAKKWSVMRCFFILILTTFLCFLIVNTKKTLKNFHIWNVTCDQINTSVGTVESCRANEDGSSDVVFALNQPLVNVFVCWLILLIWFWSYFLLTYANRLDLFFTSSRLKASKKSSKLLVLMLVVWWMVTVYIRRFKCLLIRWVQILQFSANVHTADELSFLIFL